MKHGFGERIYSNNFYQLLSFKDGKEHGLSKSKKLDSYIWDYFLYENGMVIKIFDRATIELIYAGFDFTVFYKHKSSGEGDVYRSFEKPNNFDNKMDLLLSKLGLKVNYKF